jgi:hypothetical protein
MPYVPDVARIGIIPPFSAAHQILFGTAPDENSSGKYYNIAALRSGKPIDASVASESHGHWASGRTKPGKERRYAEKSMPDTKQQTVF